jgi:putative hydrolase of the HAD superfamily
MACTSFRSELGEVDPESLYRAIEKTREWFWTDAERHRRGRLDLDAAATEVVALSLAELGSDDRSLAARIAAKYRRDRQEGLRPLPGAIETLHWLREHGCRLALLTNGSATEQRWKIARFQLADVFDATLIEGELGFGKPDPRIYTRALEGLAVSASDAWMVGDNLEWDVEQPQRMGMSGIWIDIQGAGLPEGCTVRPTRIVKALRELRARNHLRPR